MFSVLQIDPWIKQGNWTLASEIYALRSSILPRAIVHQKRPARNHFDGARIVACADRRARGGVSILAGSTFGGTMGRE
jgi:hypothetical protein